MFFYILAAHENYPFNLWSDTVFEDQQEAEAECKRLYTDHKGYRFIVLYHWTNILPEKK